MIPDAPIALAPVAYPMMLWTARHRRTLPVVAALVPSATGATLAGSGHGILWLMVGMFLAAGAWGVTRLVVELICLLVETLVPQ